MNYVKYFSINGIDTKQVACIELNGRPNEATEGAVGVLGIDVTSPTHEIYKCAAVRGSSYTWELLASGLSILYCNAGHNGEETTLFSYDSLILPDNYLVKIGDLILDGQAYLYQIISLSTYSCEAKYCNSQFIGRTGKSAYDLAVEKGFDGSLSEWLESLRGKEGEQGEQGVPGEKGEKGDPGDLDKIPATVQDMLLCVVGTNGTQGLRYMLYDDYAESAGIGKCIDDSVEIGSIAKGLPVTSIGESAFEDCNDIEHILIPESVISINNAAFRRSKSLSSISLPDTLTTIGQQAFDSCDALPQIVLPDGVVEVGAHAFANCPSLKNVTIGRGVERFNNAVFENSPNIDSVFTTKDIGAWCNISFYNGSSNPLYYAENFYLVENGEPKLVTDIVLPDGLTSIGDAAFYWYGKLVSVIIPNSVTSIGDIAFQHTGLTSVDMGTRVTSIGMGAFSGCNNLTSVSMPGTLTTIGRVAFSGCNNLTSVSVPVGVTSIGKGAFTGCSGLTSMTLPFAGGSADENTYLGYLFGASIPGENATYVPSNLKYVTITKHIGNSALLGCSNITRVTIGASVTSIGSAAFSGCTGLTDVSIGNGVTSIESRAFNECSSLTSITLPNNITSIANGTFRQCTSLKRVDIPASVTSIGSGAFSGCSALTDVYYEGTQEMWNSVRIDSDNYYLTRATIHYK